MCTVHLAWILIPHCTTTTPPSTYLRYELHVCNESQVTRSIIMNHSLPPMVIPGQVPRHTWELSHKTCQGNAITTTSYYGICPFFIDGWYMTDALQSYEPLVQRLQCQMHTLVITLARGFWNINIARGTTDPGYWVQNLNNLSLARSISNWFKSKNDSSHRLNTLCPLCLWYS